MSGLPSFASLFPFVSALLVLLVSISIHEFSHAITADRLGDSTPRIQGRVTLNPIKHLDPMGTMMILLSSLAGFGIGWGKPVQVQPANFRTSPYEGMGLVAIAGPISNLVLATLGGIVFQVLPVAGPLREDPLRNFALVWVSINVALAFFNLIPIFPLDGYNVLVAILYSLRRGWSVQVARLWQQQVQFGPMLLILLLVVDNFIPGLSPIEWVFRGPVQWVTGVLLGVA